MLAFVLTLIPSAMAPPPGACEPWPACKGGGGENALSFASSNIVTLDQGSAGKKSDQPIFLWQSSDPNGYAVKWRSEVTDRYYDVLIGDPDSDGEREIVAFTYESAALSGGGGKGKKPGPTELRVYFHVYEAGSPGVPDAESAYVVVERNAWSTDALIADVDGDNRNEIVAIGSNSLAIFGYDPNLGYVVEFESGPQPVTLNDGDFGDVDGDGALEIVTGTSDSTVYVWDRQSNGDWIARVSERASSPPLYNSRVGDVTGDGLEDVVGVSHDSNTGETFISVWNNVSGSYALDSTVTLVFGGGATGYGFGLGDLDGDLKSELVMGASDSSVTGQAMVLSYNGGAWTTVWSTVTGALTNDVWVGDVDGVASTMELVFTGAKDGLYVEVFTWSPALGGATSSFSFTGQFNPASDSHIG